MSYVPGSSVIVQIDGIGLVSSETLNPPTPLEYGRSFPSPPSADVPANVKFDDADNKLPYGV